MAITVDYWDAHDLNDASYRAWLAIDDSPYGHEAGLVVHAPIVGAPMVVGTRVRSRTLPVHIQLLGNDLQAAWETLNQWFRPGSRGQLLVTFGAVSRALDCSVQRVLPYDGSANVFTVILLAPDPRWRSADVQRSTQAVTASPTTWAVTNDGNTPEDGPLFRVQPYALQAAADGFRYRKRVVVVNRAPRELANYAVELTEEWDHAAEVSASRSASDGDDVRVFMDGVEVDRWDGEHTDNDWNSTKTKIWVNGNWQAARTVTVATAMTATSPLNGEDLEVDSIAGFPESGRVLIGDELIHWHGVTARNANGKAALQNVIRAYHGTTAATHSVGDVGYWEEHEIWVYYGWTGAPTYTERTDTKPLLDLSLATLTNIVHSWTQFSDSRYPGRSMGWTRRLVTRDDQSDRIVAADGGPLAAMGLAYYANGAQAGKPAFNQWSRAIPCGVDDASNALSYVSTQSVDMAHQALGADADGNEVILTTKVGTQSSATVNVTPAANLYDVRFWSFNPVLWAYQPGQQVATSIGAITTTATDTGQRLTVGDEPITVTSLKAWVTDSSVSRNITASIYADAGGTPLGVIAASSAVATGGAGAAEELTFTLTSAATLQAGQKYWVCFSASNTGVTLYAATPAHVSSATRAAATTTDPATKDASITVIGYRGALAASLERLDTVGAPADGNSTSIESVTVTMDSALVPYVAFLAREDAAYLDATLRNVTTGQSLRLRTPLSPLAKLEVDVGARALRNLAECPYALNRAGSAATYAEVTDAIRLTAQQGDLRATPDGSVGIWPATTNLYRASHFQTITDTWVTKEAGVTIGSNSTVSLGGLAGVILTAAAGTGYHYAGMASTPSDYRPSITAGDVVTISAVMKAGTSNYGMLAERGDAATHAVVFNLGTGAINTQTNATGRIRALPALGSGFYLCEITYTATNSFSSGAGPGIGDNGSGTFNAAGTETVYVNGLQMEKLRVATPLVLTTAGGTASRTASRVRVPVHDLFSEEQGWVSIRWRPGWSNAAEPGGGSGSRVLFDWRDASDDRITLSYDEANNRYLLERQTSAGTDSHTFAATVTQGTTQTVTADWTAGALGLKVDGSDRTTAAAAPYLPTLAAMQADIGQTAAGSHLYGDVLHLEAGAGVLVDADGEALYGYGDTDPDPEQLLRDLPAEALPRALWWADDGRFFRLDRPASERGASLVQTVEPSEPAWLRLDPGSNRLAFEQTGVVGVRVETLMMDRWT